MKSTAGAVPLVLVRRQGARETSKADQMRVRSATLSTGTSADARINDELEVPAVPGINPIDADTADEYQVQTRGEQ